MQRKDNMVRLALPSKGRLAEDSLEIMHEAGLEVYKPNPRQYLASIPLLPGLQVVFQRPGDIAVSVRDGSVDFGITGMDVYQEKKGKNGTIIPLHSSLGFGRCRLAVIIPEALLDENSIEGLFRWASQIPVVRIATKYPELTKKYLNELGLTNYKLIAAEGALEIAPTIGYADIIVDLVSSGMTLRDNRLVEITNGVILNSQACLIANRERLSESDDVLAMAKTLLEYLVAHIRAKNNLSVFVNIQGDSAEVIGHNMLSLPSLAGLEGPTISPVITNAEGKWFAAHLVVQKNKLNQAIKEIRSMGGSGLVVTPITYLFEEEPVEIQAMMKALEI